MNMNIKIFNKIKAKQSILSKDQIEGKSVEYLLPRSRSHHGQDNANFRLVDLFERLKRSQEYCLHFKNTYPFLSVF
jgi:hypothetical protein